MGNYAIVAQIQSEFKDIDITSSTNVKTSEVDAFIDEFEAIINGRLASMYTVPITGTEALKIMRLITIWMTCFRISRILQIKDIDEELLLQGNIKGKKPKNKMEQAEELLEKVATRKIQLTDEVIIGTGGLESFANDESLDHQFKKDEDAW